MTLGRRIKNELKAVVIAGYLLPYAIKAAPLMATLSARWT